MNWWSGFRSQNMIKLTVWNRWKSWAVYFCYCFHLVNDSHHLRKHNYDWHKHYYQQFHLTEVLGLAGISPKQFKLRQHSTRINHLCKSTFNQHQQFIIHSITVFAFQQALDDDTETSWNGRICHLARQRTWQFQQSPLQQRPESTFGIKWVIWELENGRTGCFQK